MKKQTLLFLTFLLLLTYSCKKNVDTVIVQQNESEKDKDYFPGTPELAKKEVLEFLKTTKTFNNSLKSTTTSYQDRLPSEGKWVIEGAGNYLVNGNLSNTKSDIITTYNIAIENIIMSDGTIKMKGTDMSTKFDNLFASLNLYTSTNSLTPKLIDVDIVSVDNSLTHISLQAVFGGGSGSSSAWPTVHANIWTSAQVLEDAINTNLSNSYWFSNVEILNAFDPTWGYDLNIFNQEDFGCTNCLWSNAIGSHPLELYTNCFPASAYPTYYDRAITLMNSVKDVASQPYNSYTIPLSDLYETAVIGCSFSADIITSSAGCSSDGGHTITDIFIGYGLAY